MRRLQVIAACALVLLGVLARPAFAADSDNDGLDDALEATLGTDPYNPDSDGDGLLDGEEYYSYGSDPLSADGDGDGLGDWEEVFVWFTDPSIQGTNTDGDGWGDGYEVLVMGTSPTLADTDGDTVYDDQDSSPTHYNGSSYGGSSNATFANQRTTSIGAPSGNSPYDGSGVLLVEGSLQFDLSTAHAKGVAGLHHALGLHYDSQSLYDGRHGIGWTSILDTKRTVNGAGDVTLKFGGQSFTWTWNGATWDPPAERPDWRPREDGSLYIFDWIHGPWISVSASGIEQVGDQFGNTITYNRTGATITSVTDSRGQQHTLSYYATGRLRYVTMADQARWEFRYNSMNQLWKVIGPTTSSFPNGITQEFRYSNGASSASLNSNLLAACDGRGSWWLRNRYDSSDRVVKQYVGGSASFDFDYTDAASSQEVTVTDRAGNERLWAWDASKLTKETLTEYTNRGVRSGEDDYTTTWTTDQQGYIQVVEFPRGNGVKYDLNGMKLPVEIRRKADISAADDDDEDLIDTYVYDSAKYYAVTSHTDPEGHETVYTVNAEGRVEGIEYEEISHVATPYSVTEGFTWNADGTLETATDGEGKITSYTYGTGVNAGRVLTRTVDDGGLDLVTTYAYTAWGDVSTVTDPNGNTTTFTVERYGNVEQVAAPGSIGYVTQFDYDGNLNVVEKRVKNIDHDGTWLSTPSWWTTTTDYTIMDRPSSMTEDVSTTTTRGTGWTYTVNDQVASVMRGTRTDVTVYDERDLVYERRAVIGGANDLVTTLGYDGNRNLVEVVNPRGKTTTMEYDLFDRRVKTINALGDYEELVLDKGGHVTERKFYDELGATDTLLAHTKYTYDEMHRLWKEEAGLLGGTTSWLARTMVHDKRGLVTLLTDRRGYDTVFAYDGAGRRISTTDELGNLTEYELDANGNAVAVEETEVIPGSQSTETFRTEMDYDVLNRLTLQTVIDRTDSSNTKTTEWKRSAIGLRQTLTAGTGTMYGHSTAVTFVLDGLGRTVQKSEDLGSSAAVLTSWELNDLDLVTKLTDDSGNETLYQYDDLGRLVLKTYESTKTVGYEYDANGNVEEITDQNGTVIAQGFDDLDRLIGRDITPGTGVGGDTDEDFVYDALGRLTEAADDDSIVQMTYDSLSRVLTEVQGSNPLGTTGKSVSFTWDAESNRTKVDYPSGFDANETRDVLGRLTEIEDASSNTVAAFDLYGPGLREKKRTLANGTYTDVAYDGFRRPTDIDHKSSGGTRFAGFAYAWDSNDNPLMEARSHQSGKGDVYSYDKVNRLTKVLRDVDDPAAEVAAEGTEAYVTKLEYDMDDVLNLTAYKVTPYGGSTTTTSFTTNAMNEYTAVGGATHTYTDAGSLADDNTKLYAYDAHQHLIEVRNKATNAVIATYAYDALGLGRRIGKVVGNDTTRYVHAGVQAIEEYDGTGSGANLRRLYVFGERIDQIVAMEAPDAADVDQDSNTSEVLRFSFHTQLIGSVTQVTAPSGSVVESYEYDPYGKPTIKDGGGTTISASAIGNSYLFTARQLDAETGLYYYRARHYSPDLRRFIQRDPLEYVDGPNAVGYVSARATTRTDPTGCQEQSGSGRRNDYTPICRITGKHNWVPVPGAVTDEVTFGDVTTTGAWATPGNAVKLDVGFSFAEVLKIAAAALGLGGGAAAGSVEPGAGTVAGGASGAAIGAAIAGALIADIKGEVLYFLQVTKVLTQYDKTTMSWQKYRCSICNDEKESSAGPVTEAVTIVSYHIDLWRADPSGDDPSIPNDSHGRDTRTPGTSTTPDAPINYDDHHGELKGETTRTLKSTDGARSGK